MKGSVEMQWIKGKFSVLTTSRLFYPILAGLAVIGIAMILFATRWGAALSDDSYFYIKPARDLLAGRTPFFSQQYPPMLPLLITLIGLLKIEPLQGIRLLNAFCFGLNVFLAGYIIYRLTSSRGVALVGAIFVLTSRVLVEVHSWAMSEALFITLTYVTILLFDRYFSTRKPVWLVACGIAAGCSALTRYAGVGVIGSGVLVLLFLPGGTWGKRIRLAALFGTIAGMLFAAYSLIYVSAMHQLQGTGGINFQMLDTPEIREAFYNLLLWLMPGRLARGHEISVMLAVVILVVVIAAAYILLNRRASRCNWEAILRQPLFLLLAFLMVVNIFILYQAHISPAFRSPFDTRLLSPTHAVFLLLLMGLVGLVWKENGLILHLALIVLLAWGISLYPPRTADFLRTMHEEGAGFASPYWHDLDAKAFILSHRSDVLITTAPTGVYFSMGIEIPAISMNPDQLRSHLRETNGYLVVFNSMPLDMYGYPAAEFLKDLSPVQEFSNCIIYQARP